MDWRGRKKCDWSSLAQESSPFRWPTVCCSEVARKSREIHRPLVSNTSNSQSTETHHGNIDTSWLRHSSHPGVAQVAKTATFPTHLDHRLIIGWSCWNPNCRHLLWRGNVSNQLGAWYARYAERASCTRQARRWHSPDRPERPGAKRTSPEIHRNVTTSACRKLAGVQRSGKKHAENSRNLYQFMLCGLRYALMFPQPGRWFAFLIFLGWLVLVLLWRG